MPRALIIAGTGAIGFATAQRLTASGWSVTVTGRSPEHFPDELRALGVRFGVCERDDAEQLRSAVGAGADLLVDCACKTGAHARTLVELLGSIGSTVMISSRAVYVDDHGRHSNSERPPSFDGPVRESQPTLRPDGSAAGSREGYGPHKVAAEQTLLESGHPVSVLRAAKVHGPWSRRPREWFFVRRVLDGRRAVLLPWHGLAGDHCCAAANIAGLIELLATMPGRRVLNIADPDVPRALDIARLIAARMRHSWQEIRLPDGIDQALARTPWDGLPPFVLDTSAAAALGYTPVGTYAETVIAEIEWLLHHSKTSRSGWPLPPADDPFFAPLFDYAAEDRFLAGQCP